VAEAARARGSVPPLLAIVGKKHVGKTTLVVRVSAELTRRGHRVMILKHGSHTFSLDPAATDTYRHYHEGQAARVAMASPDKFALVSRWAEERTPEELAAEFLADADLVLCEGFKRSALPKVEIARREAHATSLWADGVGDRSTWRAMVTDAPPADFPGAIFPVDADAGVPALCDWIETHFLLAAR